MLNYFVLENGESSVFGYIRRKAVNEFYCLFFYIGIFNLLFRCWRNEFTLNKNLVADLQESLSKYILSFSERFSKGSVTYTSFKNVHFWGTAWYKTL